MIKKILILMMVLILSACNTSLKKDDVFEFELKNIDGNMVRLSDFKGKKVYLKLWASWCSICLNSLDETDKLAENDDFVVISMVAPLIRGEKDGESFKKWYTKLGYKNLPVLFDEGGKVMDELGVFAYPSYVFFDENGKITHSGPGHVSNKKIIEIMSK